MSGHSREKQNTNKLYDNRMLHVKCRTIVSRIERVTLTHRNTIAGIVAQDHLHAAALLKMIDMQCVGISPGPHFKFRSV